MVRKVLITAFCKKSQFVIRKECIFSVKDIETHFTYKVNSSKRSMTDFLEVVVPRFGVFVAEQSGYGWVLQLLCFVYALKFAFIPKPTLTTPGLREVAGAMQPG